jgi:hypothetical protein
MHCPLFTIHCLEKVLHLGEPQERTFRYPLFTSNFVLMQDLKLLNRECGLEIFTGNF